MRKGNRIGFGFGVSQALQYASYAVLYYAGAEFASRFPQDNSQEDIFKAIFATWFATFAVGQAQQFGPDVSSANAAAKKIFSYID